MQGPNLSHNSNFRARNSRPALCDPPRQWLYQLSLPIYPYIHICIYLYTHIRILFPECHDSWSSFVASGNVRLCRPLKQVRPNLILSITANSGCHRKPFNHRVPPTFTRLPYFCLTLPALLLSNYALFQPRLRPSLQTQRISLPEDRGCCKSTHCRNSRLGPCLRACHASRLPHAARLRPPRRQEEAWFPQITL